MIDDVKLKSEKERAQEYRDRLIPLLAQVTTLMDEARKDGLTINFNIALDQYGRNIPNISIVKPLL